MTTVYFCFISKTDLSKPVKQEVNSTVILPPLVFPPRGLDDETKWSNSKGEEALALIVKRSLTKLQNVFLGVNIQN
jgi:hypothetical protein